MKLYILLTILLVGCGSDSGSSDESVSTTADPSSEPVPGDVETSHSIAIANYRDLPECESENETQLAYVMDEASFYTCQDGWVRIEIHGQDGKDGISSNSSNLWHDSITGMDWVLGGPGTHPMALASCNLGYRVATGAEGLLAAQHGIRAIASLLGLNMEFWTGAPASAEYIGLTSGVVAIKAGVLAESRSIFCVKE